MLRNVLLALMFFSLPIVSKSQSISAFKEKTIRACLDKIYEMDFADADSILSIYEQEKDFDPSFYLLKSYYLRWKYLPITEEKDIYKKYRAYLDSTITYSEALIKKEETSLETSYYKMSAHIMSAELLASNGDFIKAAFEGRKALPIIKKGFDLCDQNPEFYISTALYNYYIEYYRQKGFFYRSLLFPFSKGDQQKGLELLLKGYQKGLFTKVESLLYLAHLYFKFENKPFVGLNYCRQLYEKFPSNFKFQEMYIENLLYCKKYVEASEVLGHLKKSNQEYYQSKATMFEGIIAFEHSKDLRTAKEMLNEAITALDNLSGDNDHYKSLASLKLAQLEEINGNLAQSAEVLKKARKLGKYPYILEEVDKLDL